MTDPTPIPFLNPKTHDELPPASGIANTMTVHEHHSIVQAMEAKFNELFGRHQELIATHEALKLNHQEALVKADARSEPSEPVEVVEPPAVNVVSPVAFKPKTPAPASPVTSEVKTDATTPTN